MKESDTGVIAYNSAIRDSTLKEIILSTLKYETFNYYKSLNNKSIWQMVEMPSNDCIMIVAIGKHVHMMFFIRNS